MIDTAPYKPVFIFRNGHFNTIYPALYRKQKDPNYHRIPLTTPDQDVLYVDTIKQGYQRLVILCHGLEGSSRSQYIVGTSRLLAQNGWDVAAMNYRYCTPDINLTPRMYHSGATDDLHTVVNHFLEDYQEIALVGFSLGGNLVLKYCGETSRSSQIKKVTAVSVPVDLGAGSINIGRRQNYFYQQNFLKSLTKKIKAKHQQFPQAIDLSLLKRVKTLFDFDDVYTGPLHGFKDAWDYYTQCSSKQFLKDIHIPCLIINALDDPFLPEECYPYKEAQANAYINFLTPKHGGHVGFTTLGQDSYWNEQLINQFLA